MKRQSLEVTINGNNGYPNFPIKTLFPKICPVPTYQEASPTPRVPPNLEEYAPSTIIESTSDLYPLDDGPKPGEYFETAIAGTDATGYTISGRHYAHLKLVENTKTISIIAPNYYWNTTASSLVNLSEPRGSGFSIVCLIQILLYILCEEGEDHIGLCSAKIERLKKEKLKKRKRDDDGETEDCEPEDTGFSEAGLDYISGEEFSLDFKIDGHTFPRVTVDCSIVDYKTHMDDSDNAGDLRPMFYVYHFNIHDPRIDLNRGVRNLITQNKERKADEEKKRLKKRGGATTFRQFDDEGRFDDISEIRERIPFLDFDPALELDSEDLFLNYMAVASGSYLAMDDLCSSRVRKMLNNHPMLNACGKLASFNVFDVFDEERLLDDSNKYCYDFFLHAEKRDVNHLYKVYCEQRNLDLSDNDRNMINFTFRMLCKTRKMVRFSMVGDIEWNHVSANHPNENNGNDIVELVLNGENSLNQGFENGNDVTFDLTGDDEFMAVDDPTPQMEEIARDLEIPVYINPWKTIRYSRTHLFQKVFVNLTLPHKHNPLVLSGDPYRREIDDKSLEFPALNHMLTSKMNILYHSVKKGGFEDTSSNLVRSVAEDLREIYFDVQENNPYCTSPRGDYKNSFPNMQELRKHVRSEQENIQFGDPTRFSRGSTKCFQWLNSMLVEEPDKFSLFDEIDNLPEYISYKDLTPSSNFWANFSHLYLEQVQLCENNHIDALRLLFMIPNIYRGDIGDSGFYPALVNYGLSSGGKSYAFSVVVLENLIEGTWMKQSTVSESAIRTSGMTLDQMIIYTDDAERDHVFFKGSKARGDGILKELMTSGTGISRSTTAAKSGLRKAIEYKPYFRSLQVVASNHNCVRDDFMVRMMFTDIRKRNSRAGYQHSLRSSTTSSKETKNRRALFSKLLKKMQAFSCVVGNAIRCGSIAFSEDNECIVSAVYTQYKRILQDVYGVNPQALDKRIEKFVAKFAYGAMIWRLYVKISSNLVPGIDPKAKYSQGNLLSTLEKILFITKEDAIMGLSLAMKKLTDDYDENDLVMSISKSLSYSRITHDEEGGASFCDNVRYKPNDGEKDGDYDYNYVSLSSKENPYFLPIKGVHSLNEKSVYLTLQSKASELGVDPKSFVRVCKRLMNTTRSYPCYKPTYSGTSANFMHSHQQHGESKDYVIKWEKCRTTTVTRENFASQIDKVEYQCFIQRDFLDQFLGGRKNFTKECSIKGFKNNKYESAIHLLCHPKEMKRKILLCGLPYDRTEQNGVAIFPSIFKTVDMAPADEMIEDTQVPKHFVALGKNQNGNSVSEATVDDFVNFGILWNIADESGVDELENPPTISQMERSFKNKNAASSYVYPAHLEQEGRSVLNLAS